ncbi:golgin IMH1-like [Lotus japonicus]|uniref:golgin IMH1-like n=1 Tax=Lotus japonicus TaxID=34305 RepID=UPI002588C447|nr:golgin IMH1-like [Lotus japonicus]
MDRVPKSEPGSSSPPAYASTMPTNLKDMSISELVAVLRSAFQTEDFDAVEEVLESRYAEVMPLREKMEFERLGRMHAEAELREKEEECERGKKSKEIYEKLLENLKKAGVGGLRKTNAELELELKEMKKKNVELVCENYLMKEMEKKWVDDRNSIAKMRKMNAEFEGENFELKEMEKKWNISIAEMRKKNAELEGEISELKEMEKKWVDDRNSSAELKKQNAELERENCELKKKWIDDKNSIAEMRKKNAELEGENSELKVMKKKWMDDRNTIAELEGENCELKEMQKKWVDDRDSSRELRKKNDELEHENCELKKKWIDDSKALDEIRIRASVLKEEKVNAHKDLVALRRKNGELEEARKKDLATVEELKAENRKLADEKCEAEELVESLKRKFGEMNERVARLEEDTRILMSADAGGGNVEGDSPAGLRAGFGVNDEEDIGDYEFGNDTGGTMKRNEDIHHSLGGVAAPPSSKGSKDARGAPAGRMVILENGVEIINLVDSDDDDDDAGCTSQQLHGKKTLSGITIKHEPQSLSGQVHKKYTPAFGLLKRKLPFSDSSSSPSSSEDELDVESLPKSFVLSKRSKT